MIRPARPDDVPGILAIWNPLIRDTAITFNSAVKGAEEVAAMIAGRQSAGHGFFVAAAAGEGVAGFATYAQFRTGTGYARTMEHTILLASSGRGRGLGRALMAAVEDHARAGGAGSMIAGVSGENPEGRAFHAAIGYAEIAVVPAAGWKFGRWLDLVLMQKRL